MSVDALAHGLHYGVLAGGVVGLGYLLLPQALTRHGLLHEARPDEHALRVRELRESLASGSPGSPGPPASPRRSTTVLATAVHPPRPAPREMPREAPPRAARLTLPLAIIGSAAAAGVHAAVGPAHFREGTLIGLFFALSALVQLAWAALALSSAPRSLLVAGAAGNLAVVALWATTRTVGLPGILDVPEAVGPWDLFSGAWELAVVGACVSLLVDGRAGTRPATFARWHPAAKWLLAGSVLVLVVLSFSGARA